jgi:hypothetical protein
VYIYIYTVCTTPLVRLGFVKHIMSYASNIRYNRFLVTLKVVRLSAAKFKPLILPTYGFALFCVAYICIVVISYDGFLLPA